MKSFLPVVVSLLCLGAGSAKSEVVAPGDVHAFRGALLQVAAPAVPAGGPAAAARVEAASIVLLTPVVVDGKPVVYGRERYEEKIAGFEAAIAKYKGDVSDQGKLTYSNGVLLKMQVERCRSRQMASCRVYWQLDTRGTLAVFGPDAWVTAAHVTDAMIKEKALVPAAGGRHRLQSCAIVALGETGELAGVKRLLLPPSADDAGETIEVTLKTGRDKHGKTTFPLRLQKVHHVDLTDFALLALDPAKARAQLEAAASAVPVQGGAAAVSEDWGAAARHELALVVDFTTDFPKLASTGFRRLVGIKRGAGSRELAPGDSGRPIADAAGRFVGIVVSAGPLGIAFDPKRLADGL
ncbi:MAG: hypothetical protein HY059_09375 [Proteobacteria bacterium]|nr:hypothetical protein [Pseudomonadota bacterium]